MRKIFLAVFLFTISISANAVVVDYTTVANGNYASVSLGGTTVTGSNLVTSRSYAGFRGLGILGQPQGNFNGDPSLDFGEVMSIDFNNAVNAATISLVDISPVGNILFEFEAFNGLASLGTFGLAAATSAPQTYDLFAGTGLAQMTSLALRVLTPSTQVPIGLQVQGVSYNVVPIPAAAWLFGTALIGLIGFSKRRKAA